MEEVVTRPSLHASNDPPIRIGSWVKLPSSMSVEAILSAGADFVCLDMCNGWLSIERICELLAHPTAAGRRLVRLAAGAQPTTAGQLLDAGADGIVVPHVASPDDARPYVDAALFPPDGSRGLGSTGRRGNWGLDPAGTYLATGRLSGRPPFISIMIEDEAAVECLEELAMIAGVSQLLVGTADLGLQLGGDQRRLAQATERVAATCAANGLSAGIAIGRPDDAERYVAQGFDQLYVSNDLTLLARAAQRCYQAIRSTATARDDQS